MLEGFMVDKTLISGRSLALWPAGLEPFLWFRQATCDVTTWVSEIFELVIGRLNKECYE
jgi:hypothetical protein